jgi:hypothetical protein
MERFRSRLRGEPELRREYRITLALQLAVVGALFGALIVLVVQSFLLLRSTPAARAAGLHWGVPAVAGFLSLAVLRRMRRLVADYRDLRRD